MWQLRLNRVILWPNVMLTCFRYELREDRKRETQRTVGHMDTLRQDIAHTFRPSPSNSPLLGSSNKLAHSSPNSSMNLSGSLLTPQELEYIRHEIVKSVRHEVREAVRDALSQSQSPRNALLPLPPPSLLPPINSELYHTHLYTELWHRSSQCWTNSGLCLRLQPLAVKLTLCGRRVDCFLQSFYCVSSVEHHISFLNTWSGLFLLLTELTSIIS